MIIDTMIAAYACFEIPEKSEASRAAIRKARALHAPESFRAEFLNTVWQYGRAYGISPGDLEEIARDGLAIPANYIETEILWRDALALALTTDHSPYDTLFVAAAVKRKSKVLTCDNRMLKLFPKHAIHLLDYVS